MSEHIERMIIEEKELSEKINKLNDFLHSQMFYTLHQQEQWLLEEQIHPMNQYRNTLKRRIAIASGWIEIKEHDKGQVESVPSRY